MRSSSFVRMRDMLFPLRRLYQKSRPELDRNSAPDGGCDEVAVSPVRGVQGKCEKHKSGAPRGPASPCFYDKIKFLAAAEEVLNGRTPRPGKTGIRQAGSSRCRRGRDRSAPRSRRSGISAAERRTDPGDHRRRRHGHGPHPVRGRPGCSRSATSTKIISDRRSKRPAPASRATRIFAKSSPGPISTSFISRRLPTGTPSCPSPRPKPARTSGAKSR